MKTSNTILAGFLILIFLVPAITLLSFKSKIRKGEYTLVNNDEWNKNERHGQITAFKVVKVMAPSVVLECQVLFSDSSYYSYDKKGDKDSVSVFNEGDTLFVQYINPDYRPHLEATDDGLVNRGKQIQLQLNIPALSTMIIEHAAVEINSLHHSRDSNLHVELYGNSRLDLGVHSGNMDTAQPFGANEVLIRAIGSNVTVGNLAAIRKLQLQTGGATVVNIMPEAVIGETTGYLSDSTTVNGSWKWMKKFSTLNK